MPHAPPGAASPPVQVAQTASPVRGAWVTIPDVGRADHSAEVLGSDAPWVLVHQLPVDRPFRASNRAHGRAVSDPLSRRGTRRCVRVDQWRGEKASTVADTLAVASQRPLRPLCARLPLTDRTAASHSPLSGLLSPGCGRAAAGHPSCRSRWSGPGTGRRVRLVAGIVGRSPWTALAWHPSEEAARHPSVRQAGLPKMMAHNRRDHVVDLRERRLAAIKVVLLQADLTPGCATGS